MQDAYVVDAIRTPIGRYGGILKNVRPDDMLAHLIRDLLERNPSLEPAAIEDVIAGDANQAGEDNRNVARMAALLAGLPVSVAGCTVNRLCASGMQAIMDAARAIKCGEGDVFIAGGVESMTRAPFIIPKTESAFKRNPEIFDSTIGWRMVNKKLVEKYHPYSMGETAEHIAKQWTISREEQDAFALGSQEKYFAVKATNKWQDEIAPIPITPNNEEQLIADTDEPPRQITMERLATLKPAFVKGGSVTAGNSSGINDGAAALLIVSEKALTQFHLTPFARVVSMAVSGVDPAVMGIGPVYATEKILQRTGMAIHDIELVELNEAFASQSIACLRELNIDPAIVNVNGGAISLGHPIGCSGARISTTLIHEMKRRKCKTGLATMCVGIGQGAAILFEGIY
jgi:3-oxoadipyl-CoA thiolase